MRRFYIKPKIYKNISDGHKWALVKDKGSGLVCDAVDRLFFGIYISKFPQPIYEPRSQWYKSK